jgi:hypothetical protein
LKIMSDFKRICVLCSDPSYSERTKKLSISAEEEDAYCSTLVISQDSRIQTEKG